MFQLRLQGSCQLITSERLGQVLIRTNQPAARPVEQAILAGEHDDRGVPKMGIVLDQRTGLVAVQPWHGHINENQLRLVVDDLGQRLEAIDSGHHLTAALREQCIGRPTDGLAVINDQNLDAGEIAGLFLRCSHAIYSQWANSAGPIHFHGTTIYLVEDHQA